MILLAKSNHVLECHRGTTQNSCYKLDEMVSCAAVGCKNTSSTQTNGTQTNGTNKLSWHAFPLNGELRALWIAKVKRGNLPKNPKLCSAHFEARMFKRNFRVNL